MSSMHTVCVQYVCQTGVESLRHLEEGLYMCAQVQRFLLAVVAGRIALHTAAVDKTWHEGLQTQTIL